MGAGAVTIVPDQQGPVTITPDSAPQPRTWMDSVSDFGKELWNQVNPIAGIKGAAQLASHPIDSLKNDAEARQSVYDEAESAFKKGNYALGAAHLLYAALPFIGPQLDAAGNNFNQGNIAKGAGASVGMGLALAGPEAAAEGADAVLSKVPSPYGAASRMYESALKPSTTYSEAERAKMVNAGLSGEIPVSKTGLGVLQGLVDDLNAKTEAVINAAGQQGATVNKFSVASRLSDVADRFKTQVNPEADLNAVSESGNEFLRNQPTNIGAPAAQSLKQGTYTQLRGKYGELSSAAVESQKALARGIREELIQQFPQLRQLGQNEGALLELEPALERAVNRISNHQIIGIGTPIAAVAAKAVTGSAGVGAVAGLLKAVVDDPVVKSRLAIALAKSNPGLPIGPATFGRIAAYSSALGNAANAPEPADNTNGRANQ